MACSLIHEKKCGFDHYDQPVVLECLPVASGSKPVKEWQIAETCNKCCVQGECVSGSKCPKDVTSSSDVKSSVEVYQGWWE